MPLLFWALGRLLVLSFAIRLMALTTVNSERREPSAFAAAAGGKEASANPGAAPAENESVNHQPKLSVMKEAAPEAVIYESPKRLGELAKREAFVRIR